MKRVDVYYSLQSDYCYFLLDRLLKLSDRGIKVDIRPVLGGVLRLPERFRDRDDVEQAYFQRDAQRTADYLGLPYVYPDPSPIEFEPGSLWIATAQQPRNERLYRLFVGAARTGKALAFLDTVGRMLWDGSAPGWDTGTHLEDTLARADLDGEILLSSTDWDSVKSELDRNAAALLNAGHWGVPLMVYETEPFYGQDRFDQLLWRMKEATLC